MTKLSQGLFSCQKIKRMLTNEVVKIDCKNYDGVAYKVPDELLHHVQSLASMIVLTKHECHGDIRNTAHLIVELLNIKKFPITDIKPKGIEKKE